jgi:energy-coupling factor transporter transmembrane protein EcfT
MPTEQHKRNWSAGLLLLGLQVIVIVFLTKSIWTTLLIPAFSLLNYIGLIYPVKRKESEHDTSCA